MNRFKGILLSLILSATSLTSCILTDNTLGSAYIPGNQDISIKIADFDLPVTLKMADSLQTAVSANFIIGSITTDEYGTFRIGTATSITPATDTILWGKDPVFIDMYIQIAIAETRYLSPEQAFIPQNVYAYELSAPLDTTFIYNNSITELSYHPVPITAQNSIFMGGDSLKMHFTKEYGERFFSATLEECDSTHLFINKFYGLYFRTDDIEEGLTGGRLNYFDIYSADVRLSFTSTNEAGKRRDTSVAFRLGEYLSLNSMTSESGNRVTDNPVETLYYESLSGIKPHVSGAALHSLMQSWAKENDIDLNNLVIAKATLEFPFEYSGNYIALDNYPGNLFPCRRVRTKKHTLYKPIDEIYDSFMNNGSLNRSLLNYKPDIGFYLQDLIKKDSSEITDEDDLWLMQTISHTNSTTNVTTHYPDFTYYNIAKFNGTGCDRNPKLRIVYTVLK